MLYKINTTLQISGTTIIKGNGYVLYEDRTTGHFTVVTKEGLVSSGIGSSKLQNYYILMFDKWQNTQTKQKYDIFS